MPGEFDYEMLTVGVIFTFCTVSVPYYCKLGGFHGVVSYFLLLNSPFQILKKCMAFIKSSEIAQLCPRNPVV